MAYTYDLGSSNAASLRISKVRLLIPDNDSTAYDLEDAEITYFLTETGNNVVAGAVKACNWLARKYAKKASFSADGLTMHYGERARLFAERARELETEVSGGMSAVTLSRSDGYSEAATDSDYESRIVYVKV